MKNKFNVARADTVGAHQDVMVSLVFQDTLSGIRLIGDVQIHDRVLF